MIIIFCFIFTKCRINAENKKRYRFDTKIGDSINVIMDVSNDYDISSNLPFEISQNGLVITMGAFLTEEEYDTFSEGENSVFNYLILIDGSSTGFILKNTSSEESIKDCFN